MNIVIIGAGNVAQVLGKMLLRANHAILQVAGRDKQRTTACAAILSAEPVTDLSMLSKAAEVCIIATSDGAVPAIAAQLQLPDTVVLHTSGGVSISTLQQHPYYGVLYPLQSLRKELPYLPVVPLFIDGNNEFAKDVLYKLANTIADNVQWAGDEERLKLHVAAVFCSNFTNHLFALAYQFCSNEQLPFTLLLPLITETVHRMQFDVPAHLQTGPAIRGDEQTIQKHLQVLHQYPLLAQVYTALTRSIQTSMANK